MKDMCRTENRLLKLTCQVKLKILFIYGFSSQKDNMNKNKTSRMFNFQKVLFYFYIKSMVLLY